VIQRTVTVTVVATLEWILVRIDASAKYRTFSPIMDIEHGTDALGVISKLERIYLYTSHREASPSGLLKVRSYIMTCLKGKR